jgi:hypothetical protein
MAGWKPIAEAPRGIGLVLVRIGAGSLDPVSIGYQSFDDGRWFDTENREIHPLYFCLIPPFDADDEVAA